MKKINLIMLSLIFMSGNTHASFLPQNNPLKFGQGNAAMEVKDLRSYGKPNKMYPITPGKVMLATEKDGTKSFYMPTGKLALSIAKDGTSTFYLSGAQITKDKDGNLTSMAKNISGTNMVEITNEFGEIIEYKEMDGGGKVYKIYDYDMNLKQSIHYDQYGKNVSAIINEFNKGQTIYGANGLPIREVDFENNVTMRYDYDDNNRLVSKVDIYGNRTHYASDGSMTYTENKDGIVLLNYTYGYNSANQYCLISSFDPTTRSTTYYENNRPTITKNYAGAIEIERFYNGSTFVASFDRETQEMTWYDLAGRAVYKSIDNTITFKYIYSEGELVGGWNAQNNQLTVYYNERMMVTLQLGDFGDPIKGTKDVITEIGPDENSHTWGTVETIEGFEDYDPGKEPTAEDVLRLIEAGLLDHIYISSPL
ncbi:MAG: hypothetical protein LBQ47_08775 [Endomicrobium sp.]|nr:hypothetical protein [Endomicrobium sp.]